MLEWKVDNMKVYVLTHCAAEKNYTPSVFTDRAKAEKEMEDAFESVVYQQLDDECGDIQDCVDDFAINNSCATVTYVDDTYDVWEIFEVEVK